MKKLSITLFTLIWISLFGFSTASAGGLGFGVTASYMNVEAAGTETDSLDSNDASTRSATVDNDVDVYSAYVELAADNGFAFGVEMFPGSADVSDAVKTRSDTEKSVQGTGTTGSSTREFKANAEVEDLTIVYTEIPLFSEMFYGRIGYAQVDVNTTEVASSNGGSYGNVSLDGLQLGVGMKGTLRDNVVWKTSYEQNDFSDLRLVSTGNASQSGTNTIEADLDTWALKLSLGYQF